MIDELEIIQNCFHIANAYCMFCQANANHLALHQSIILHFVFINVKLHSYIALFIVYILTDFKNATVGQPLYYMPQKEGKTIILVVF